MGLGTRLFTYALVIVRIVFSSEPDSELLCVELGVLTCALTYCHHVRQSAKSDAMKYHGTYFA